MDASPQPALVLYLAKVFQLQTPITPQGLQACPFPQTAEQHHRLNLEINVGTSCQLPNSDAGSRPDIFYLCHVGSVGGQVNRTQQEVVQKPGSLALGSQLIREQRF